jgi:hypothetical protein
MAKQLKGNARFERIYGHSVSFLLHANYAKAFVRSFPHQYMQVLAETSSIHNHDPKPWD